MIIAAIFARYLFALQVKRDLSTGVMPCQEHTAVLLASYIVQGEKFLFLYLTLCCAFVFSVIVRVLLLKSVLEWLPEKSCEQHVVITVEIETKG